jgi:hypothetical protein
VCARGDGAIWEADGYTLLCGSHVFMVAVCVQVMTCCACVYYY